MGRVKRIRKNKSRPFVPVDNNPGFIELMKYLKTKGWKNDLKLRVGEFSDTGHGVYSLTGVTVEEDLIRVPSEAIITLNTLENDLEFVDLCEKYYKDQKFSYQCLLSLFLVFHVQKGADSDWEKYLKIIPQTFTNPYFCEKRELCHLDEHLLLKMVNQKEIVKKGHAILVNPDVKCDLSDFEHAYFAINTRGVYIDPRLIENKTFKDMLEDAPTIALVPFLDFFNHSDKATILATANSSSYTLTTKNSYKKYEQIFINYGPHNNLKLLVEYGFIIPNNKYDYVEVTVNDISNLIKSDPELRTTQISRPKFQFITNHNLSDQMFFDIRDGPSHNLLTVLFMVFLEKNVHNLRNVAFGDALKMDDVLPYAKKLLEYKMEEFQRFADGLLSLDERSRSGEVCLQYYQECLSYLEKCKNFFENNEIIK